MYYYIGGLHTSVQGLYLWPGQNDRAVFSMGHGHMSAGKPNEEEDARRLYRRVVQDAWTAYRLGPRQRVLRRLQSIQARGATFVASAEAHATENRRPVQDLHRFCHEITEDLIDTCAELAQPAYHLGNVTGQTDYFHMWLHLWRDVVDMCGELVPKSVAEQLPPLYAEWPSDSILKRAFMRRLSGSA